MITSWPGTITRWWARRRTSQALVRLPDRLLQDIGASVPEPVLRASPAVGFALAPDLLHVLRDPPRSAPARTTDPAEPSSGVRFHTLMVSRQA